MEKKLEELKVYNESIRFIKKDENLTDKIPIVWKKLLEEDNPNIRVKIILEFWKEKIYPELSNTIEYLEKNLKDVEVTAHLNLGINRKEKYYLLYTIENKEGETCYYEGGNVFQLEIEENLKKRWEDIPVKIRKFYEEVHNGFYEYYSGSMGLEEADHITYFEYYDWGIIDDLEEKLQISLRDTFGFFKSGAGGYVAVDLANCNEGIGTVWFSASQPEYNIKFWDVVDEWIVIGFDN